jgi:hypothetical protein
MVPQIPPSPDKTKNEVQLVKRHNVKSEEYRSADVSPL